MGNFLVSIVNNTNSCLSLNTSFATNSIKADKLTLEMEPATLDNNMISTLKPH